MAREVLYEGRFVRLVREGRWEYVQRTNTDAAVMMIALTTAREIVLIDQYRIPLGSRIIELPAGLVADKDEHKGESIATTAERELVEETGYRSRKTTFLFTTAPSPGLASERIHFFLCEGLEQVGHGGGDSDEDIKVHVIPLVEVDAWLKRHQDQGGLVDPKVYAGLYLIRNAAG